MSYNTNLITLLEKRPPNFSSEVLRHYSELDNHKFISYIPPVIENVDLKQVVGTSHPSYSDRTWKNILKCGQRITDNLDELKRNPHYYLSDAEKKHFSFDCLDGEYFITQGNHRTAIAKFFFHYNNLVPVVHGVSVTYRTTNKCALNAFNISTEYAAELCEVANKKNGNSSMWASAGKPEEYLERKKGFVTFYNGASHTVVEEGDFIQFQDALLNTSFFRQLIFPIFNRESFYRHFW